MNYEACIRQPSAKVESNDKQSCVPMSRLRLRRNDTHSFEQEIETHRNASDIPNNSKAIDFNLDLLESRSDCSNQNSMSPNEDDSLVDFKSPKLKGTSPVKVESVMSKPKRKLVLSKTKSSTRKESTSNTKRVLRSTKVVQDRNQQSIETSLLALAPDVKTALVCPLCFRSYKDESTRSIHMKSCAVKNKVTTKKLLDAVELQDRQAEERKAMGLLAAPVLQAKKNVSRKPLANKDAQLDLALALSISLHEMQQNQELEEAEILAGEPSQPLPDITEEERRVTLQNFGFFTDKPVMPPPTTIASKRKKRLEKIVLDTRTQEERDRILTERIAEVLVDDETITQRIQEERLNTTCHKQDVLLNSRFLRDLQKTENRLWDRTRLSPNSKSFYVEELAPFIMPNNQNQPELHATKQSIQSPIKSNNEPDKTNSLVMESADNNIELPIEKVKIKIKSPMKDKSKLVTNVTAMNQSKENFQSMNTLATNWGETLNQSPMSDVIVYVEADKHIWIHKLVLFVRCPEMMLEIVPDDDQKFRQVKEKICWPDIAYCTALAFLEFIYCGTISRNDYIFNDADALSTLRKMARKYRVKDLFTYFRERDKELETRESKVEGTVCNVHEYSENNSPASLEIIDEHSKDDEKFQVNVKFDSQSKVSQRTQSTSVTITSSNEFKENDSTKSYGEKNKPDQAICIDSNEDSNQSTVIFKNRLGSVSPDLFDDLDEETSNTMTQTSMRSGIADSGINGTDNNDILMELIDQDTRLYDNEENRELSLSGKNLPEVSAVSDATFKNLRIPDENLIRSTTLRSSLTSPMTQPCSSTKKETPKSRNLKSQKISDTNVTKQKSNLSLLIEKVQRQNARSLSESDTDTDSPLLKMKKRPRNPFKRKNKNEYSLLDETNVNDTPEKDTVQVKRSALSMLEEDVRKAAAKNRKSNVLLSKALKNISSRNSKPSGQESLSINNEIVSGGLSSDNDDDVFCLTQSTAVQPNEDTSCINSETTTEEEDMSMYSKYKRKHSRNSIEKYRLDLRNVMQRNASVSDASVSKQSSSVDKNSSLSEKDLQQERIITDNNFGSELLVSNDRLSLNTGDTDMSDLEICMSSSSTSILQEKLNRDVEKDLKNNRNLNGVSKETNSFTHVEVSCSKFCTSDIQTECSVLTQKFRNDVDINFSDLETDVDCQRESNSQSNRSKKCSKKKRDFAFNLKNIHDLETDVDEPEVSSVAKSKRLLNDEMSNVNKKTSPLNCSKFKKSSSQSFQKCVGSRSKESSPILDKSVVRSKSSRNLSPRKSLFNVDNEVQNFLQEPSCAKSSNLKDTDTTNNPSPITISSSPDMNSDDFPTMNYSIDDNHLGISYLESTKSKREMEQLFSSDINIENIDVHEESEKRISNQLSVMEKRVNAELESKSKNEMHEKLIEIRSPLYPKSRTPSVSPSNRSKPRKSYSPSKTVFETSKGIRNLDKSIRKLNDTVISKNSRHDSSTAEERSKSIRSLRTKSVSEGNFRKESTEEDDELDYLINGHVPSFNQTPVQNRIRRFNSETTPLQKVINDNVTPPANYSAMKSPELRKELQKYGLKVQKRSRAKQLLRHIYNELHPIRPISPEETNSDCQDLSTDDEQPPNKKINQNKTPKKSYVADMEDSTSDCDIQLSQHSNASDKSNCSMMAEEELFNESNATTQVKNPMSIEDAFRKLINDDTELHNKVLTYEPLPLESLHGMLKEQGVKCKLNVLMDFLDEQCISFRSEQSKRSRTRKKK